MVGEVEVVLCYHVIVVALMPVLNVHTEDVTIITNILLIQLKNHELVSNKLIDYLSLDKQKKLDAIFCADNQEIG